MIDNRESKNHYQPNLKSDEEESSKLSDLIPSSLESDYEEVKLEARRKILKDNRSSYSLGLIVSDIRDETQRNQIDFKILSRLKKDTNLI